MRVEDDLFLVIHQEARTLANLTHTPDQCPSGFVRFDQIEDHEDTPHMAVMKFDSSSHAQVYAAGVRDTATDDIETKVCEVDNGYGYVILINNDFDLQDRYPPIHDLRTSPAPDSQPDTPQPA